MVDRLTVLCFRSENMAILLESFAPSACPFAIKAHLVLNQPQLLAMNQNCYFFHFTKIILSQPLFYNNIRKYFSKYTPASLGTCDTNVSWIASAKNASANCIDSTKSCPRIIPPIITEANKSPVPE